MANNENWKPQKSPYQAFASRKDHGEYKTNVQTIDIETSKPVKDIWQERALWMLIGIFITIVIIWLSNSSLNTGNDENCHQVPDRGGIIECE